MPNENNNKNANNLFNKTAAGIQLVKYVGMLISVFCLYSSFAGFLIDDAYRFYGNAMAAALICGTQAFYRDRQTPAKIIYLLSVTLSIFLIVQSLRLQNSNLTVFWLLVTPLVCYLCLPLRAATLFSVCFFIGLCFALYNNTPQHHGDLYTAHWHEILAIYAFIASISFIAALTAAKYLDDLVCAKSKIKALERMLTMCMYCRKVNHEGDWLNIERYLDAKNSTRVSHGVCPKCTHEHFSDFPQLLNNEAPLRKA